MYIEHVIARGQVETHAFGQLNVAASQAAVALPAGGVAGADIGKTMLFAGDLIGYSWHLSAAGTAGVFTIVPTINGTAINAAYQQTVGTAVKGQQKIPRGAVRFVAGDVLGVKITTNGSWDGTTADLDVTLRPLVELDGI